MIQDLRLLPLLPRSLSSSETWGFGLTGLLLWLGVAPAMQLELGWQAMWVWLPGAIIGILINLQVQRLGEQWTDLAGGTPSYLSRLLPESKWLATYGALGYYLSWVAVLPVNALVLTDLVEANLEPFGVHCSSAILQVGFTAIAFIVAFSGTRALGVLHLFFVVPAVSLLLLFCFQGIGWLATHEGAAPVMNGEFLVGGWAKWYVVATYAVYACESGSAFVADSRFPRRTLKVLPVSAALIPIVYLAGSWILLALGTTTAGVTPYQQILAAAPFWGKMGSFLVTFLLASGSLLSCATAVSNSPRMLYQLALDGQLPPIFARISRQGILGVGLLLTLVLSIPCLLWGNIPQIVFITGLGWLSSFAIFHWGLWRQREQAYVRWPWWSLGFAGLELVAVIIGGLAWNWQDLLLGLSLPGILWILFQGIGQLSQLPWKAPEPRQAIGQFATQQDWAVVQIAGLIGLLMGAMLVSWFIHGQLVHIPVTYQANVLVVVLLIGAAVGVAIAGWTTFPQITALGEAREQAEQFFNMAADGILILDAAGHIQQANQASEVLFQKPLGAMVGESLDGLLPNLSSSLFQKDELTFTSFIAPLAQRTVEVTLSTADIGGDRALQTNAYVAIVRDITKRQAAENALRQKATELEQLLNRLTQTQSQLVQAEKMSSLGQLVAGVAHEINNPLAFIAGNIDFARDYALNLLELVQAYQTEYPQPSPALAKRLKALELEFLQDDFPKLLSSMEEGSKRILDIVQSLKTFSRHDESPTKLVNLHEGIESTLVILGNRLKARGPRPAIRVKRDFSDLPPVECYPSALNQVFMNLLVNAIDALETVDFTATEAEPTIAITTYAKELDDRAGVEITISDNGPGIPDKHRDRLCDPFFTTKPIGKGTGLGLSISYQVVVERHLGSFYIDNNPNGGAQFTIWLPLTLKARMVTIPTTEQAA